MNKNSTLIESDDFDEFPEITAADLGKAVHRRGLLEVSKKENINLRLDADIIAWLKNKSDDKRFQSLINSALRDVMSHNGGGVN